MNLHLPQRLIGLFDPATAEFERERRHREGRRPFRRRRRPFRGGAVFGPGVPGGARQATPDELAGMRAAAEGRRQEHHEVLARCRRTHATAFQDAAASLRDRGEARLQLDGVELEARLLQFWRGSRVLRIEAHRVGGDADRSSAMVRMPRHDSPDVDGLIVDQLTRAVAGLQPDEPAGERGRQPRDPA